MNEQAVQYFNHAVTIRQSDPQTAYRLFTAATQIDPNFTEAWRELGNHLADNNLTDAALGCYRQALHSNPGDLQTLMSAGYRTFQRGDYDLSKKFLQRAILVDNKCAYAHANMSLIYSVQGHHEQAIAAARKAHALATEFNLEDKTELVRMLSLNQDLNIDDRIYSQPMMGEDISKINVAVAFAYLHAGVYAEGLKWFESRIPYKYPRYLHYPYPRWDGSTSLKGKTIVIESDGGIGDTISYYRFLLDARIREAGKIILIMPPALTRLTERILPMLKLDPKRVVIQPLPNLFPVADIWVPMLSLPVVLKWSTEELMKSRFFVLPHKIFSWEEMDNSFLVPNKLLHIGVTWAGNKENDIDIWRSFSCHHLLELAKCPGVQLYSLQVGERSQDMYANGASAIVRDMAPFITDVVDTLRITSHLDLVICAESAMCHIAGLMDKACIVPYSYCGRDWRIGNADKPNIWYPHQNSIRQDSRKLWEPVFKQIVDIVNGMTAHRRNSSEVI